MSERLRALVAVHIFFIREGTILLLRRANTGYEDGSYSVPAGHLDGREPVTAAAIREAFEETGICLAAESLQFAGVMHLQGEGEWVNFFFAATDWLGEPSNSEPGKCDELAWYPLNELPTNTVPYVRQAIENYRGGVAFAEFGWG